MVLGPVTAQSVWSTTVARHRAELFGGMQQLEQAIETPAHEYSWRPGFTKAVAALKTAVTEHVLATEGPAGLYSGLLEHAPRLARGVANLMDDHRAVLAAIEALDDRLDPHRDLDVEAVRRQAAQLLQELAEHWQRGADLVYEAYVTDIGGET
jgi:hypothetical protein